MDFLCNVTILSKPVFLIDLHSSKIIFFGWITVCTGSEDWTQANDPLHFFELRRKFVAIVEMWDVTFVGVLYHKTLTCSVPSCFMFGN